MISRWIFRVAAASALAAVAALGARQAQASQPWRLHGCYYPPTHPDLFYNFYVPPCSHDGVPAQLYVSPRPTPPWVGHTYITYQPLMPHEFLYRHHRTYFRYHPGSGVTKTKVYWW